MNNSVYDLCIIGAGPAGYAAAIRAWDLGKNICLIEKDKLGGAGIHNGVLPSKTLWELSKDYVRTMRQDRGYVVKDIEFCFDTVRACVQTAIEEKQQQLDKQLKALSESNAHNPGKITLIKGHARFLNNKQVELNGPGGKRIQAENFIIATGSRPRVLDSIEIDGTRIMTSDDIMGVEEFPKSLVILGAGVVGCEFATIFANFGRTKVSIIDRADRVLPFEDEDVSRIAAANLEKKGVVVHHKAKFLSIKHIDNELEYSIEYPSGDVKTLKVSHALVSIGRVPNTNDIGLENTDVCLNERGYIQNKSTQSDANNIYAVGDVTQDMALVNVGETEGRHAVERMFGLTKEPLSYQDMSTIIFVDPEIAAVGLNEKQAKEQNIPYRCAVYGLELANRAVAMRATDGFIKLLTTNDDEKKVLGMRALGVHASSAIEAVALMIKHQLPARDLAELIHPHPAITEAVQECARIIVGTSIYKPEVFQELRLVES